MAEFTSVNTNTDVLLQHRLVDISIGSSIGIIGGVIFIEHHFLNVLSQK